MSFTVILEFSPFQNIYRLHMSKWFPSDSLLQYSHSCLVLGVEVSSV